MSQLDFAYKVLPKGYQIINEEAIKWLFKEHRQIYDEFYKRLDKESVPAKTLVTPKIAEDYERLFPLAQTFINSKDYEVLHGNIGDRKETFRMGIIGFFNWLRLQK